MIQDDLPSCLRWSADSQEKTNQARALPAKLFSQLSDALKSPNPPTPPLILAAWNERLKLPAQENDSVTDETLSSWINAYEIAWQLRQAAGDTRDTAREPYVRLCAKLLASRAKPSSVPIATVDGHSDGRIQTLWIDIVDDEQGLILLHPQFEWTREDFDADFLGSIEIAWRLAGDGIASRFSVFWHVTEANGDPVISEQQSGTSASAAALHAFWDVRRDLRLDEDVFVLASCSSGNGSIQDVGDLGAKISAIRRHRDKQEGWATIVIAATTTNRTPQDEIVIAQASNWAKVKPVAITAELIAVRSCTPPELFVGSHYVLFRLHIGVSGFILLVVTIGVVFLLRTIFEGLYYQVACSAEFGGFLLVGAVLVAARIIQRGEALSRWLISGRFHAFAAVISVIFGVTGWSFVRPTQWGDIYYHLFIAPLLLYLAITLLPVIFSKGKRIERYWVICFALVQILLLAYDFKHGRLSQRPWIEKHWLPLKQ